MSTRYFLWRIRTAILLMMPLFVLASCGNPSSQKTKPPAPSISTQAEQYMLTQALAEIALEKGQTNPKLFKSYAKSLNAYGSENKKELQLAVLSIEYELSDQPEKHALLVPVPLNSAKPSFTSLRQVQRKLSALPHTLYNLQPYYVMVTFPPAQKFSHEPSLLQGQLNDAQKEMMSKAAPPTAAENAKLQLQLVQFFMKMRVQDAAYLALENAKDSLATMAEKSPELDITSLSQEADALEARLRKEMPYKL